MAKTHQYKAGVNQYMKDWRAKRKLKGHVDPYNYTWRTKNPKAYLIQNAKARAKKKNWEFNLTPEDFEIPLKCPVLGITLELTWGEGIKDNKPSLDRIDCKKGYTKENVRVLSWRANNLLSDGSLEEFTKIVEFLNGHSS